jgi:hypothetical protein
LRRAFAVLVFLFVSTVLSAQANDSQRLPNVAQAEGLLHKAASAQFGSNPINDVQLTGTAILHLGIDQRGPVTLQADASGRSKVTLNLDGGQRTEYSSGHGEDPACTWTGADGKSHDVALHNCWIDGAWFSPALSLFAGQQQGHQQISYSGAEHRDNNGAAVEHLTTKRIIHGQQPKKMTEQFQHLSNEDLYIDSATSLPTTLTYFIHPDNDVNRDIPIEIRFSDYRDVSGVKVPFRIEKLMNGSTLLEITLESASFNTGVPTK